MKNINFKHINKDKNVIYMTRANRNYPYGLLTRIDFGKHIGSRIKLLIEHSKDTREYLQWALKNVEGFSLTIEAKELLNTYLLQ